LLESNAAIHLLNFGWPRLVLESQRNKATMQCRPIEGPALERQLVLAFDKNLQHQSAVKTLCDVAKKQ
jgi:hypothetical protein